MSNSDDPKPKTVYRPRTAALRAEREMRLAEALRRNLKRRKDQFRGRIGEHSPDHANLDDRKK